MADFILPGATSHGSIISTDLALISDAAGNINKLPWPTERTYHLTVPESTKNADHTTFGLVDWILPKPTTTSADAAAVQAAINAAPSGARFLAPQGVYTFNAIVSIPASSELHGAGKNPTVGTVFKMANAANLDTVLCDAGWLSLSATPAATASTNYFDFCVDANRTNQSSGAGHGVVGFSQGSTFERLDARNTIGIGICPNSGTQAGFAMTTSCNEIKIKWCTGFNCGEAFIRFKEFNAVAKLTDGFVTDCVYNGNSNGDYGIRVDGAAGHIITNNHIYAVKKSSIAALRNFGVRISDNYVEGFGIHATPGTYCGIDCELSGALDGAMISITGNQVIAPITNPATGTVLYGIAVQASSAVTEASAEITGNILRGRTWTTPTTAILIHNASSSSTFHVREENIVDSAWDVPILIGSLTRINLVSLSTGQARFAMTAFSATPTILPARVEAANQMWGTTLTGNITGMTMTAGRDGQLATLITKQDATGSRTVVWPTNSTGLVAPAAGANAVTAQTVKWVEALSLWVKQT